MSFHASVLDDSGRVRGDTIGLAVALDVAVPRDTDLVLKPVSHPQTAIGERQQVTHRAFRKLVSRSRHIPFKMNAVESKEPVISAYPQKSISGLCQSLRPAGIPLHFAPRPVCKRVDVAIPIQSSGAMRTQREETDQNRAQPPKAHALENAFHLAAS